MSAEPRASPPGRAYRSRALGGRLAANLQHARKNVAREIGFAGWEIVEHCWLANVDACIYPVAQLFAGRGLFLEMQNPVIRRHFDHAAFSNVIAMMHQDG